MNESLQIRLLEQLRAWRDDLINLQRSNRLLYFKHTRAGSLEIVQPSSTAILERLNSSSASSNYFEFFLTELSAEAEGGGEVDPGIPISRGPKPSELVVENYEGTRLDGTKVEASLRLLERKSNQYFIDKGLRVLYIGLGELDWVDPRDSTRVQSPLLLVPVEFSRSSLREPFRIRLAEGDAVLNPSLAVKLANEFAIDLPSLEDWDGDSLDSLFPLVRAQLGDHPDWVVRDRAVFTTFSFHKEAMYRDLLSNESSISEHPVVQMLALGPDSPSAESFDFEPIPDDSLDGHAAPEDLASVRDADSSQRRCIIAAREGRSFVMDGPPGTGKSQTITNVIAELLLLGRTVLFVSEKAAALDVVHKRLAESHIDDFVLELHSHSATRKAVAAELGVALVTRPAATARFDASERERLVRSRTALSEYAQAMNEVRQPLGRSLHQVLGRAVELAALDQAPPPPLIDSSMTAETFIYLLDQARVLSLNWNPVVDGERFLWRDLVDASLSAGRHRELVGHCEALRDAMSALQTQSGNVAFELHLPEPADWPTVASLNACLALIDERPQQIPPAWLSGRTLDQVAHRIGELAPSLERYKSLADHLQEDAGAQWPSLDPALAPELIEAWRSLGALSPKPDLPDSSTLQGLRAIAGFLESSVTALDEMAKDGVGLSRLLGLPSDGLTLTRVAELAELGALAGEPDRPEAQWLNPALQGELDRAFTVLDELVSAFNEQQRRLDSQFLPAVLELDLRGLRARFREAHQGAGKLRKQYRQDKAALRHCTVAGKVTPEILAQLDEAVVWSEIAGRLHNAEGEHRSLIGDHYYRGPETNFARLASAIAVARKAVALAGAQLDISTLQGVLAYGAAPDATVKARSDELHTRWRQWRETAGALLGAAADRLTTMPITDAVTWCRELAVGLGAVIVRHEQVETRLGRSLTLAKLLDLTESWSEAGTLQALIEDQRQSDSDLLGPLFKGIDTDSDGLHGAIRWAQEVLSLFPTGLTARSAQAITQTAQGSEALGDELAQAEKTLRSFLNLFRDTYADSVILDLKSSFDEAHELITEFADSVAQVDTWSQFVGASSALQDAGLAAVIDHCIQRRIPADQVVRVVERAILEAWADSLIQDDSGRLSPFDASRRDALVTDFRELDRRLLDAAAARIVNACSERRPNSRVGAASVIAREAEKQKRHMPIRELLQRAGPVAQLLKPCFMMSPLAVSQYLPPDLTFDVVIFDEASQVLPSDAINCIYRGNQLIVAGDENQLPPSNFFAAVGVDQDDDVYDEEALEDFESVLKLCKASGGLPSLGLKWHYRSQHEDLITYSNHAFYGGSLLTFPGAAHTAPDLGIEVFKVDGAYRRSAQRDNPVEAAKVVDRILFHRHHHPELTLGVVAFSAAQEDAVVAELERRSREHPELASLASDDRLDGFFVKNLEDVQGDERDIIIFTVGYGPDQNGRFTLQMGPLTKAGGWRRLNVAITRARRRVEIVTSVLPGDFPSEIPAPGIRHLRRYLDFGIRGEVALALDPRESLGEAESPFEAEVLSTVRRLGYEAVPQVGLAGYRIDIGVRDPRDSGRFLLGVECDGAMYHSSKAARDRDRLRQSVIESLGWKVHRIWGIAWFRDRQTQEERLRLAIEAAMAPQQRVVPREPSPITSVVHEEIDLDAQPEWTVPYVPCTLAQVWSSFEMHDPNAKPKLRELLRQVVDVEAPVHRERALRLIREAWDVGRAGHRIRAAFDEVLRELATRGECENGSDGFLRKAGSQVVRVRIPTDDPETLRPVSQLPPEELDAAVYRLIADAHSASVNDVRVSIARIFGWARTGPDISDSIDRSLDRQLAEGAISQQGDLLTAWRS